MEGYISIMHARSKVALWLFIGTPSLRRISKMEKLLVIVFVGEKKTVFCNSATKKLIYFFNAALQGFMNSYVHRACCANSIYFLKYCILKPKQNRRLVPICRTYSLGLFLPPHALAKPSVVVERLTLLLCIGEVPGSNLGPGDRLSWLRFFVVFLSPSRRMSG
jgi:hypothetical protein